MPWSRYAWRRTSTSDADLFLPAMTFETRYSRQLCLSFNSRVKVDRWFIFLQYYTVNSILPRRHVNKIFPARQTNEYFTLPRSLFSLLADGIADILSRSLVFLFIFPRKFRYRYQGHWFNKKNEVRINTRSVLPYDCHTIYRHII